MKKIKNSNFKNYYFLYRYYFINYLKKIIIIIILSLYFDYEKYSNYYLKVKARNFHYKTCSLIMMAFIISIIIKN
jgi:hypothetical protein